MPFCHGIISNMVNISRKLVDSLTKNVNDRHYDKSLEENWNLNKTDDYMNVSYEIAINDTGNVYMYNQTVVNGTVTETAEPVGFIMANIKLLKAVVLGVVVVILLLTTCKFILKTFSKYSDESDRKD